MAKIGDTMVCHECGGEMRYEERPDPVTYKGHTRPHKTKAWWCTNCDEAIFEGKPLLSRERALVELRAEVEKVMLPEEVAAIRERLGISQREAGRVLGGGVRAFQKYESGTTPVSEPMKNLLLLLGNDPARLKELVQTEDEERKAKPKKRLPQRVRDRSEERLVGKSGVGGSIASARSRASSNVQRPAAKAGAAQRTGSR